MLWQYSTLALAVSVLKLAQPLCMFATMPTPSSLSVTSPVLDRENSGSRPRYVGYSLRCFGRIEQGYVLKRAHGKIEAILDVE